MLVTQYAITNRSDVRCTGHVSFLARIILNDHFIGDIEENHLIDFLSTKNQSHIEKQSPIFYNQKFITQIFKTMFIAYQKIKTSDVKINP